MMKELDQLLSARAAPKIETVPDALMARILADAAREQPQFSWQKAAPTPPQTDAPMSLWQIISDLFGGGKVVAGLATAACAGIYLGVAQPVAIGDITLALAGSSAVDQLDFMPSIDTLLAEEEI